MTRAALYVRVSTDEQVESGYSIPDQKRDMLAYAEQQGWSVVEVIVDEGHSGAVGVRPGLDRIMALAEAGKIDVVLAKKRNRLFRDRYIRMGYERALLEHNVRLVALDDAGHRLADAVMDEFGDWYREEVTKNTVAGRLEKARQGRLVASASLPIYGFAYTPDRESYVVVPETMAVVDEIVHSIARGEYVFSVKRSLERRAIPAPRGGQLWATKTIRNIVFEDAYLPLPYPEIAPLLTPEVSSRLDPNGEYGLVWYPRRRVRLREPDPSRGYRRSQTVSSYAREEQIPIPVVSSGIPREVIEEARAVLKSNRQTQPSKHRVYELAGFLRCAHCGNLMSGGRRRSGSRYRYYYRCSLNQREGRGGCEMYKNLRAEQTEEAVLHAVLDAVKDRDELIRRAEEDYEAERRRVLRPGSVDIAALRRERDELEGQRMAYFRQAARGRLTDRQLDALVSEVDHQQKHLDRLVQEHEDREYRLEHLEAGFEKTVDLIRRGRWHELGITEPQARNARYREIGLSAEAAVDGSIRLSWRFGEEAVVSTQDLTSRATPRLLSASRWDLQSW